MKVMIAIAVLAGIIVAFSTQAANLYAGQDRAATVCAQCHGVKVPSADAPFPSLAGRDEAYLKEALKQYRGKKRVSEIMNAVAGSLRDSDIEDLAAYYSEQKP